MTAAHRTSLDASVIINTYQQEATIGLLLTALRQQDFSGGWEIIVIDDGSDDRTPEIVARHVNTIGPPVRYRQLTHNGNRWSAARNLGIRISAGETLIFLDGDMIPDRDLVRRHVTQQAREPCLLAGNRMWRSLATDLGSSASPQRQLEALASSELSNDPVQRSREAHETRWRQELLATVHPWRAWFGCHVSVPASRDVWFDEDMAGWGPVDIELACRLHDRHGTLVRFHPEIRAWHLESDGAISNPFRTGDPRAATQYVLQVCHMIRKYPHLPLRDLLAVGFDRIAPAPDGTWVTVPRGMGGDPQDTLDMALAWHRALPDRESGHPA